MTFIRQSQDVAIVLIAGKKKTFNEANQVTQMDFLKATSSFRLHGK